MKRIEIALASSIALLAAISVLVAGREAMAPTTAQNDVYIRQQATHAGDRTYFAITMKDRLPADVYQVMYEAGTEPPFSSPLNTEHRAGTFVTADTGLPVFRSEDKYDSGTGWPSFTKPIEGSVELRPDDSLSMDRIEVVSKDTGAHLGHVFDDGPEPTGKRYCMNGLALKFIPDPAGTSTPPTQN